MFNYKNFEGVFDFGPDCSYEDDDVRTIEKNRRALEGLFIDKVMKMLGIKRPPKYYPPKSNNDLKNLHKAICDSTAPDHHKISVLYYILLDFDFPTKKREHSTTFENRAFLPQKYQIYMKGLWHMDRQDFDSALQYLTYPSLTPEFADEILEILVKASKNDFTLPLAYYHTVAPTLKTRTAIECLFSALARTSVTEAWVFARAQNQYSHRHMLEMLISLVLHNSTSDTMSDRCVELVGLALSKQEEEWMEDYLLRGEGMQLKRGRDMVMMRRIGTGNFKESLELKGIQRGHGEALNWGTLSGAVKHGLGARADF